MLRTALTALHRALDPPPSGGAIIEFALIMPFLVVLLVSLSDLGFGFYQSMQVQAAAEAGAQYAMSHSWDPNAVATAVTSATRMGGISATPAPAEICGCSGGGVLTPIGCSSTCPSGDPPGVYASVSAQLQYQTVLPYPGLPGTLTLTGQTYRRLN